MSDDLELTAAPGVPDGFVLNVFNSGYGHLIGPLYSRRSEEREIVAFRVEGQHANNQNNCHGGMLMGFADMAWGRVVSNKARIGWVTVRLTCDFLAGAKMGDWVEGDSVIVAEQDDVFTVHGRIWCGERTLMTGVGIFKGVRSITRHPGEREAKGPSDV